MPRHLASPLALTLLLVVALTAVRIAVLFTTPLELYPDEAQYWLWSRELAWGYYSKPPMVAWLIAGSTAIGGDAEAWIRLPSALAHGLAALALYGVGARLSGPWTGFWGAALYSLMPAIQLSSGLMTTDAPLLLFLSLALLACAYLFQAEAARSPAPAAAALGLALGLAFLSKYAALYFVIGLVIHAAASREARRRWTPAALAALVAAFAVTVAPNLLWNAGHGFATVTHTASNANWGETQRLQPR
jgi:4-amino-4-deoxy-L-arabinose transferase-like glycosyltransferase